MKQMREATKSYKLVFPVDVLLDPLLLQLDVFFTGALDYQLSQVGVVDDLEAVKQVEDCLLIEELTPSSLQILNVAGLGCLLDQAQGLKLIKYRLVLGQLSD